MILQCIYPYLLYLHIFQLERYTIWRSLRWIYTHFTQRRILHKTPLVYTKKIRHIIYIVRLLLCGFLILTIVHSWWWLVVLCIFIVQPYFTIMCAIVLLKPAEIYNRARIIRQTTKKITNLTGLITIAVAGSYGKTSVKDILYTLLSTKYKVLKTPLSYNTIFGIAAVVDLELDASYEFFICELGEFYRGDIIELCKMVQPQHGIITGINEQHLERFGNINNTIATIFELADYLLQSNKPSFIVVNGSSQYTVKIPFSNKLHYYGNYNLNTLFQVTNKQFSAQFDSIFCLTCGNKQQQITSKLIGDAHINNILGASTMAYLLNIDFTTIAAAIAQISPIKNRCVQTMLDNNVLLIDNSYSSNVDGFKASLALLAQLPQQHKILVTPGIIELGSAELHIHVLLGEQAACICTKIILVGKSLRTAALAKSAKHTVVEFINSITEIWAIIKTMQDAVVLIENDLPDNYA